MTYSQRWESTRPGCLIFLLDQSASMSDPFASSQAGGGKRKCDMVATVLNGFLNELIVTNTIAQNDNSTIVKPRADVAVLGYGGASVHSALGGNLAYRDFVSLPELQMYPLEIERRMKREIDEVGMEIELPVQFPIWVKPTADAGTPMCSALQRASALAQEWAYNHPQHYPPVIVNVTDGMATDGDPYDFAQEIHHVSTEDGSALLFSVHLTDINSRPVTFPGHEDELPNDRYARKLFSISSPIPTTSHPILQTMLHRSIDSNARGLIFNGDAASIRHMFVFATVPATQPLDLDR